jgi:tRNA(His) 5'-end guanylyltransferase
MSQEPTQCSLQDRMTKNIRQLSGKKCHPYKAHIVSVKSNELLKCINHVTSVKEKVELLQVYNQLLIDVCIQLYRYFDPSMIYYFNHEIHLVFFYNEEGNFIYNGDVMKTVTNIVSHVTSEFIKATAEKGILMNVRFSGTFAEFDRDYETLNYIVWRQWDCLRNNTTLLYKCLLHDREADSHIPSHCQKVSLDEMTAQLVDVGNLPNFITKGNIIKKSIVYKMSKVPDKYYIFRKIGEHIEMTQEQDKEDVLAARREWRVEHVNLSENFKESLQKYIINKFL